MWMPRNAAIKVALAAMSIAVCCNPLCGQFTTPSINGVIQPGEYGNTQNGTNQIGTNTGQTWYMTWDASRLYVGIANANLSEGAVIYIDANPVNPPNGGTNANGNLSGLQLRWRADRHAAVPGAVRHLFQGRL